MTASLNVTVRGEQQRAPETKRTKGVLSSRHVFLFFQVHAAQRLERHQSADGKDR
jgi:hypothetical protein